MGKKQCYISAQLNENNCLLLSKAAGMFCGILSLETKFGNAMKCFNRFEESLILKRMQVLVTCITLTWRCPHRRSLTEIHRSAPVSRVLWPSGHLGSMLRSLCHDPAGGGGGSGSGRYFWIGGKPADLMAPFPLGPLLMDACDYSMNSLF